MANIKLDVALNLDDSQYKSGVKSVEQSLKKFSTTPAFVKLKLDESDFRKQYQDLVKSSIAEIDKLNALQYKTKGGAVKIANSTGTMQSAYKYHLEMSQNEKLSKAERNRHAASELALRRHLNLISLIGLETKAQAKIQAQERAMPARLEQAKRSGQVAAAKKRAYDAEFAEEKHQKKDDELYRRRYLAFAAEESKIERERAARIAQLQREADQRAKATRNQYDQRIAAGTDTRTPELDALRRQYQEEERLAANAAKREKQNADESAKQLQNRIKAKRNAKDIEVALENEKIAREKVSAAQERTNANRTKENIEKEIKALKELKKAEDDLDKAQGKRKRNSRVSSATNQRIQELQTELDALRNNSNELDKQSGLLKRLGSLAARYFSIQQIVQFGRKIAETTGYFQKQQVALEGILQSATDARKVLNEISNFALQSPFRTDELVRFTKQLSAFGIDTADLFPTVKQLADISAGLGVDMDRIILAYGQVKSAAVLRGQELRQFTEAGIPMVEELAKRFTALNGELVTTSDVFDLISKRQVPFEMVAKVMADMTAEGGRFYKMQENITETMHGQMEKLKDIWTLSLNDIGKSSDGFFMGIIKGLQVIAKNTKSVAWGMAAAFASGVVTKLLLSLGLFTIKLQLMKTQLASLKRGLASGLAGIALGAVVGVISKAYENATKLKKALEEVDNSFYTETNKMISGLNELSKKITSAKVGTKEYNDAVEMLAANYGSFISIDIINKLKSQSDSAHETAKSFAEIAENVKEAIQAYNDYKEIKEKQEVAKETILEESASLFKFKMLRQGDIYTDGTRNDFYDYYGRKGNTSDIRKEFVEIYKNASREFIDNGVFTKSAFEEIFEKSVKDVFPHISEAEYKTILADGWNAIYVKGISGQVRFNPLTDLNVQEQKSAYYGMTKYFNAVNPLNTVYDNGDKIEYQHNIEAAYVEALHKTLKEKLGEQLPAEISDMLGNSYGKFAGRTIATNLDNNTLANINKALFELKNTFTNNPDMQNWIEQVRTLFNTKVEEKTGRAAIVSNLMENSAYRTNDKTKGLWSQFLPTDRTYDELRNKLKAKYDELNSELNSYISKGGKDKVRIDLIEEQINAVKELASVEFFNVNLNDPSKQELPTKITDLFSEMKNAYTRYKEAVQKGGIEYGLGYVRNDEQFQKMFGQFFGGAEGEKFKNEYANLEIGSKTIGELFQGKFLDGLESGVLDFEGALLEVISELEEFGNADKENRKAYLQAAKQLKQWVDSNFSKDNLSVTLDELEKKIKDLTNTFEKTNRAVDAYRQLQKNGTIGVLGSQLGITREQALTPESKRQADNILELVKAYNSKLPEGATGFSIGNLSKIDDVSKAIEEVGKITKMNNENFPATKMGKAGDDVTNLLKQLLDTLIKEATSLSGEVFTGNTMNDLIANAKNRINGELFDLTKQENVARAQNTYDMGAIKAVVEATQEEAQKLFDQLLKENNFDVLARSNGGKIDTTMLDELKQKLTDIAETFQGLLRDELLGKIDDLENAVADYNAKVAAPGSMMAAFNNYKNAGTNAAGMWYKEKGIFDELSEAVAAYENGQSNLNPEQFDNLKSELKASKDRLDEMGGSAEALEEKLKKLAIDNLQKSAQEAQSTFNAIAGAANSVIDVFQSLSNTINKVYDVMNDGENPKWMKDMDGFLNDFADSFQTLIAPITAVMAAIVAFTVVVAVAGTTMGIVFGALIAAAAIFALVIAAIQSHDRNLQATIEDLEKHIEDTKTAMTNLDAAAERMVGIEKFETQLNSLSKNLDMYKDSLAQAKAEQDKKDTDTEKVKEYQQNAQEYLDAFKNGMKEAIEEVTFSVEDMASKISDAMRSAFQSGENAARAMRDVVKESIGDIIQNLIELTYLQPALQSVFEDFLGMGIDEIEKNPMFQTDGKYDYKKATEYFIKRAKDPEAIASLESGMEAVTQGNLDIYNALDPILQHYMSYSGGSSDLSGGISGISEDTARSLEGLSNSILMQQVISNGYLSSINDQFMAVVQTNWFNQMLEQSKATRLAADRIDKAIADMQTGIRPISVIMK